MKRILFLSLLFPVVGFTQKAHVFSFSGSYGFSSVKSKTFGMFVEGFNAFQTNIETPLKDFSNAKTFDFTLNFPLVYIRHAGVHLGYSHTNASTSVTYTNGEGRTFDFTRRGFNIGLDLNTKNVGMDKKGWLTFSNSLFNGWQDITTAYQYQPGLDYHGAQQKNLNGQYYIASILFQTELSYSYKIKNISIFIKGGISFPNLLKHEYHNLERAQTYTNITFLPTDLTAYYADPFTYEMDAIDNPDLHVSARNWIYTGSLGLAVHFVERKKIKRLREE